MTVTTVNSKDVIEVNKIIPHNGNVITIEGDLEVSGRVIENVIYHKDFEVSGGEEIIIKEETFPIKEYFYKVKIVIGEKYYNVFNIFFNKSDRESFNIIKHKYNKFPLKLKVSDKNNDLIFVLTHFSCNVKVSKDSKIPVNIKILVD